MDRSAAVAIAIGSNLGDREAHLVFAWTSLQGVLQDARFSSVHQTDAAGPLQGQPKFLNAAITGDTFLTPRQLLDSMLALEEERGRDRPFPGAARTLDLDLILFGTEIIAEPGLTVPHPRFRDRGFVLRPLVEIASDWLDPVTGLTVAQLLQRLQRDEAARASSAGPDRR